MCIIVFCAYMSMHLSWLCHTSHFLRFSFTLSIKLLNSLHGFMCIYISLLMTCTWILWSVLITPYLSILTVMDTMINSNSLHSWMLSWILLFVSTRNLHENLLGLALLGCMDCTWSYKLQTIWSPEWICQPSLSPAVHRHSYIPIPFATLAIKCCLLIF